jgi:hypothetical protein
MNTNIHVCDAYGGAEINDKIPFINELNEWNELELA